MLIPVLNKSLIKQCYKVFINTFINIRYSSNLNKNLLNNKQIIN